MFSYSDSTNSCHGKLSPLHVTVSQVQAAGAHKHKHSFTVLNYGSHNINDIPGSPVSVFSDDGFFPELKNHEPKRIDSSDFKTVHQQSVNTHSEGSNPISIDVNKRGSKILYSKVNGQDLVLTYRDTIGQEDEAILDVAGKSKDKHVTIDIPDGYSSSEGINSTQTFNSTTKTKKPHLLDVIKRGRIFAHRRKDRLVYKDGSVNVTFINVSKKSLKFFQDAFTTLIDVQWRYLVLIFVLAFLVTWIGFAFLWWALAVYDINSNIVSIINGTVEYGDPVCLDGVYNFPSAVLFSIETQHTIGYGTRSVTPECPLAIIFVMIQSLIGVILACVTTGLIFAKFSRPKYRAETILFSKASVICDRNGRRCLMFRVGDMRQNHMISVNIRAILIDRHTTKEGEEIPFMQHNLHLQSEAEDFFFLAWPIRAIHYIDESSPLWEISEEKLLESDFEIVVVFEGTNASTGQTTQVRTSFLPSEILWGHHLEPLLTQQLKSGQFAVDYTKFHQTRLANINEFSAKAVSDMY